jgi:serine/threonine protein kinase
MAFPEEAKRDFNQPPSHQAEGQGPQDAETLADARDTNQTDHSRLRVLGPYRLIRKIGEGGMGQVWLAEQTAPLQRQVALKLIRAGIYDDSLLQRFLSERQSLAIMNHPGIAKVFDAGASPEGQPYFVMEYVAGFPITDYCDQKQLTVRERLALFIQVCDAVQHAHQKAVIHRDLKPANILVVEVDGKATPRIIDFGVAKTISPLAPGDTLQSLGGFVGTPGYMSPEQTDPAVKDIDTRTDVYSLGVVLYVLLTGTLPLYVDPGKKQSLDEALRQVREKDPPSPSTRVGASPQTAPALAESRGTKPYHLVSQLRGDLDWITMKALEKDRARRYGTTSEFAADIGHYLRGEPVVARPASAGYRLRKYLLRHRLGVGAAAIVVALLAAFAGTEWIQLRRITRERDRADRIAEFMTGMFKVSDPSEARGNKISAREILDKASNDVGSSLSKDPEMRANMMFVMGTVYQNLGIYSRAQSLFEQAAEIQRRSLGPDHSDTLKTLNSLAQVLGREGKYADAEKIARQSVEAMRRVLGPRHPDTIKAVSGLAAILEAEGKYPEAEKLARGALDDAQSQLGPDNRDTFKYRNNLATVLDSMARFAEAEALFRQNAAIGRRTFGPDHPFTLNAENNVASCLANQGQPAEAEKIQRSLLDIERRVYGPEHPETLSAISNLGNYLSDQGQYPEAEAVQREALDGLRRVVGPENPETLRTMLNLVNSISEQGRYAEAEKLQLETIELERRISGPDHPSTALGVYNLACIKALAGEKEEAFTLLRQSLDHGLSTQTAQRIAQDEDLKSLHGDPRFDAIVTAGRNLAQRSAAVQ